MWSNLWSFVYALWDSVCQKSPDLQCSLHWVSFSDTFLFCVSFTFSWLFNFYLQFSPVPGSSRPPPLLDALKASSSVPPLQHFPPSLDSSGELKIPASGGGGAVAVTGAGAGSGGASSEGGPEGAGGRTKLSPPKLSPVKPLASQTGASGTLPPPLLYSGRTATPSNALSSSQHPQVRNGITCLRAMSNSAIFKTFEMISQQWRLTDNMRTMTSYGCVCVKVMLLLSFLSLVAIRNKQQLDLFMFRSP